MEHAAEEGQQALPLPAPAHKTGTAQQKLGEHEEEMLPVFHRDVLPLERPRVLVGFARVELELL
eukprot:8060767-Prorocentrum_lima.AAC.1